MIKAMKKQNMENVFLILQALLYLTFLTLDITGRDAALSNKVKYLVIILCFCYALFAGKGTVCFLKAALLLTLLADLFLLLYDYYLYGVMVFILVQYIYSTRLLLLKHASDRPSLLSSNQETKSGHNRMPQILRSYIMRFVFQILGAACVCLGLVTAGISLELLSVLSLYYFILIISNVLAAVRLALSPPRSKGNILYAWGMLLFLLCDINVGLYNLSAFIVLPEGIASLVYSVSSILMWTFYAPAQVLIAVSSRYTEEAI